MTSKTLRRAGALCLAALVAVLASCGKTEKPAPGTGPTTAPAGAPLIVGMVLVGPRNDHGWSEAHYTAGQYLTAKLPGTSIICVDTVNPVSKPGITVPQVVDDLASKGARLIFTTSDDFQDGALEAAKRHPEIFFVDVSGDHAWKEGRDYKAPPNLGNLMGRMEYGKLLMGFVAAMTTKTGKIGYLGPLINDETRRLAASAFLGARYAWTEVRRKDPKDLEFKVTWIGFWLNIPGQTLDPTKVADDFYAGGCDVVLSGLDTTEALVEAGKLRKAGKEVWALPYNCKDAAKEAPEACLGVPYFNWGPAYLRIARKVQAGQWAQFWEWDGPDWKDLNNPDTSAIGFVKGKALAEENGKKLDEFLAQLAEGKACLFQGPLNYQDGSAYLKAGERATDAQIWYFPKLLEGMQGAGGK
jgi:simple sugar transport system substrate-binding protein